MNSLQSRIHDDAARAAAQVSPADVPPLRLPPGRRGMGRRPATRAANAAARGAGWPRRNRSWLVPLAAAVSVVAVIAAVATAGRAGSGGRSRPAASATGHPGRTPSAAATGQAQAMLATEAVNSFFPATGAQYTDGLAYNWTQLKISARIFGSCMTRAGYPQPPFTEPEQSYQRSFADNAQFPDLAQRAATDSMTGLNYIRQTPVAPHTAAGHKAIRTCNAAAAKPFREISKIAGPLSNQWDDKFTAIQASATVLATQPSFAHCLEDHGIPASYAQHHWTRSTGLFAGFFAWMDTISQQATSTRQQAREEHRWTPVFVHCAGPTVHLVQTLQLSQRARFFQQHAQQIATIRTLAAALPAAGR
ncbi:MAG TPA: hypothetical protein VGM53_18590 [Streptosporangiaceae bacterium]